jgi:hypothetical protein
MSLAVMKLPPHDMAVIQADVDARLRRWRPDASADASRPWPSLARQRGQAVREICREGLGRVKSEILVHVRGDGITMDDGTPVNEHVIAQYLPTSFVRALVHDAERRPVNASARRRAPTDRQRRVVQERDRRCVGCGSTELLQFDHNPSFEESGLTMVDELELRCPVCHRLRHEAEERARS